MRTPKDEYATKPPVILFRPDQQNEDEMRVATDMPSGLPIATSRVGLAGRVVIGRYSVLPYYAELEEDLKQQGSALANGLAAHRYIADFAWYKDLEGMTPRTYFDLVSLPKDGGPWVVKGLTNSRKFEWNTMMFAPTYADVLRIARDLGQDGLIGNQGLVIREYTPLNVLEYGLNGLPFANEWRFFFWGETNLAYGFYWTATDKRGKIGSAGIRVAMAAAKVVAQRAQFFVIDVAETADGRWIVIEVNDGQMSGLSDVSPTDLYKNLAVAAYRDQDARDRVARARADGNDVVVPMVKHTVPDCRGNIEIIPWRHTEDGGRREHRDQRCVDCGARWVDVEGRDTGSSLSGSCFRGRP